MISAVNLLNLKPDDPEIDPMIYELEMLTAYDENYGESYPMIAIGTFAAVLAMASYSLRKALKINWRDQQEVEPDDQWRMMYHPPYRY